jgi:hypothetical protein
MLRRDVAIYPEFARSRIQTGTDFVLFDKLKVSNSVWLLHANPSLYVYTRRGGRMNFTPDAWLRRTIESLGVRGARLRRRWRAVSAEIARLRLGYRNLRLVSPDGTSFPVR